ncbi:MAG: response regulator [Alphaproteobacteria bacterium]|nr:response regulator [Alphaproteobacteria bacterium]MDP6872490.1 response regulator [Alphaproteobacteria bacterium]
MKNKSDLAVLVVDDVVQARDLTRALLAHLGVYWVFTASDGREAREFLDRSGAMIDLIICDWRMPRMSGLELLREVRKDFPDMPFMMVTSNSDMESVKAAAKHDVSAYIRKPYSPKEFKDKMIALLDKL